MEMIENNKAKIATWKIESDEERRLAALADNDERAKKEYVEYYRTHDPRYYQKGLEMINHTIDIFNKNFLGGIQNRDDIAVDMIYSLHRFGCMFDEYFLYHFPILNTHGRESFVTDKIRWNYYKRMNSEEGDSIFNDKMKTFNCFNSFFKRDIICVKSERDEQEFDEFVKNNRKFVVKPENGSGGRKIRIVDTSFDDCSINKIFNELLQSYGECVIEQPIIQSPKMASIHPNSVNTLRLPTVCNKTGVHLFHPLLRTGVGNAFIDNATAGGIFALVDPESGIIISDARDEKGNKYVKHPDTNLVFPGFQLPDWDQAVSLARELANIVPNNHYVGWDLAHTRDGWIMVEGNPCGQLIMMQLFYEIGFKRELEELIADI